MSVTRIRVDRDKCVGFMGYKIHPRIICAFIDLTKTITITRH